MVCETVPEMIVVVMSSRDRAAERGHRAPAATYRLRTRRLSRIDRTDACDLRSPFDTARLLQVPLRSDETVRFTCRQVGREVQLTLHARVDTTAVFEFQQWFEVPR